MFLNKSLFTKFRAAKSAQSAVMSTTKRYLSGYYNHRDDENNVDESPFEFTDENYVEIKRILKKFPDNYKQSGIIGLCMLAQKQNDNFLTLSAMNKVAKILEVPPISIYEVTSFYTMFNREPMGKYHLQVC